MTERTKLMVIAAIGAAAIAGLGFGAAQIWGEGAGMPIVAAVSTIWTAGFVAWSSRRRHL
ncbi:hypothetical protein [Sandarakinorhabdus sp.]|uniref:hypothetical protein n=1 Tax=Sandarakinorhabdus sp. TaxID=1916663 RepID=UPI003341198A